MSAYIIRRLLLMIPTLLGIMLLNFIIVQAAPGGPVERMLAQIQGMDSDVQARLGGGAEVAAILGSPNIVTTDENRHEVWIYDKFATDTAYSTSSGGISVLFLGWGNSAAGLGGAKNKNNTGATSKSQRTLTIIIKYDENKTVKDFAYHSSSF